MPATMGGCNMFALTSWLQHVSPAEIFHKSAWTDVWGISYQNILWRWQDEDWRGMSCEEVGDDGKVESDEETGSN